MILRTGLDHSTVISGMCIYQVAGIYLQTSVQVTVYILVCPRYQRKKERRSFVDQLLHMRLEPGQLILWLVSQVYLLRTITVSGTERQ